jgi:hypothetical protein
VPYMRDDGVLRSGGEGACALSLRWQVDEFKASSMGVLNNEVRSIWCIEDLHLRKLITSRRGPTGEREAGMLSNPNESHRIEMYV